MQKEKSLFDKIKEFKEEGKKYFDKFFDKREEETKNDIFEKDENLKDRFSMINDQSPYD